MWPEWKTQPQAEMIVQSLLQNAFAKCPSAEAFRIKLLSQTGIRFRDILDHIVLPEVLTDVDELAACGWRPEDSSPLVFKNNLGRFPTIVLGNESSISFKVERLADFLKITKATGTPEGRPFTPYRRCKIWEDEGVDFLAVERNGYAGFDIIDFPDSVVRVSRLYLQRFRTRRREFDYPKQGFDVTEQLVAEAVEELGNDWTCSLFLKAEREYWEMRNGAGRLQKRRQDALGIGWANEDHHTYDSSRYYFHRLIRILEHLGFECRERFYAGADAGWGSQILEQPVLGSIIFADIDLDSEELEIDFAHHPIEPLPELRRAGLWTELHGESMLDAGLNHLECMFDSTALRTQLNALGVTMMNPFSNFPHLYQELTVGEWWPVNPDRVELLERHHLISKEQAEDFRLNGAIGSHFENLERNDGYKGFNQPGIDNVLRIIDPRKNLVEV